MDVSSSKLQWQTGEGGVLDAMEEPGEGYSWDEVSIGKQMLGATRQVADTLAGKRLQGTGHGLSRGSHQCMSGRLVHDCWQCVSCTQSLCCDHPWKVVTIDLLVFFWACNVVNPTRCFSAVQTVAC